LDEGLTYYDQGKWDKAKKTFLRGLKLYPDHIDLHVHAGLCEYIDENYLFALTFYDKAQQLGKQFIDQEIQESPDFYIKECDIEKMMKNKKCEMFKECPHFETEKCKDCEDYPMNEVIGLYSSIKFRPFFRSLTNKALTLMKLKQYEKAIETLLLCQEYQPLWGTYNMIGLCYFNLGKIEEANEWYGEMLWSDAFYIKALILFVLGKTDKCLNYLLTGVLKNPHIANMLIGREKPEKKRYIGDVLPDRLAASEFIYENGSIFKKHSGFKTVIRCILDDELISVLIDELQESARKRKEEKQFRMDSFHWDLLHGNMNKTFLSQHVPRLLEKIQDMNSDYWLPKENDVIKVQIITKKVQNWLVGLTNNPGKTFYFRPRYYIEHINDGDTIKICVTKSWQYKQSLFISGDIEQ